MILVIGACDFSSHTGPCGIRNSQEQARRDEWPPNYDDLAREEMIELLKARDRRDATRFGLVWEANEIERDKALNGDFVALDLDEKLSVGGVKDADGGVAWLNLNDSGGNMSQVHEHVLIYGNTAFEFAGGVR